MSDSHAHTAPRHLGELPQSLDDVGEWVGRELVGLFSDTRSRSGRFVGGQSSADAELERLAIVG